MTFDGQYQRADFHYPDGSVIMAPLSGYTDLPYRRSLRRHGCYYAFTEMIDAGSLAHSNPNSNQLMARGDDEPWLGVQLVGSDQNWLEISVDILNQHHFDVLDFNLGCPVPKVVKKGAGAALGAQPEKAATLLGAIVRKSRFPVTAKTRILDEADPAATVRLVKLLEDAGAQAITIHGRIRSAYYSGPVYADIIAAAAAAVKIPIIANGGIMGWSDAERLRETSGCSVLMIARGAMGNPWLFRELIEKDRYVPPTPAELAQEMILHMEGMVKFYGEQRAMLLARKIVHDYMKGRGYPHAWKAEISFLSTMAQLRDLTARIEAGPAPRYWQWQEHRPAAEHKMTPPSSLHS